jgi:hypothetical protein
VQHPTPRRLPLILLALLAFPSLALAQADEIQVYDGGLAAPGVFNLTWHNNFTASGVKRPAFPGGVTPHHSWNGVPEWAYGVTKWFEAGLYMPLYTHDERMGFALDGFKLRTLFAVPNADDRTFFYGANFEFSVNAKRWDTSRITSEVRPIVGWHLRPVDIIVNPIVDTAYDGFKNLVFAPATRVAYTVSPTLVLAAEEYADFGPLHDFHAAKDQLHQLYGVVDYAVKGLDIETGIGFGLTDASDHLTFKIILSHDFTKR